jgi:four helix bundle protein
MSRDHTKLRVFQEADRLVDAVYRVSEDFSGSERYGLQSQVRRAAVSVTCNLVEGCARRRAGECVNFFNIALGSASETRYLLEVAGRVGACQKGSVTELLEGYARVIRQLERLVQAMSRLAVSDRGPSTVDRRP